MSNRCRDDPSADRRAHLHEGLRLSVQKHMPINSSQHVNSDVPRRVLSVTVHQSCSLRKTELSPIASTMPFSQIASSKIAPKTGHSPHPRQLFDVYAIPH